uniref:Late embryogenesis abundant protein LEA-2 subgroup domain-containing protein n=1 Tax=Mycena chlorophos TaxID=658473 RepID=A0ABQ0LQE0_MYCCL|nr:predicted protein [Mycena chlorophos]
MAYNDPYNVGAGRYGGQPSGPQYGQYAPQVPQYGQYNDAAEYNPYLGNQPHATYDQGGYQGGYDNYNYAGGYRDEPQQYSDAPVPPPQRQGSQSSQYPAPPPAPKSIDETSRFEDGEFPATRRGPKTASNMRAYRREFQGNLWTKGGRGSCFCRFFLCILFSLIFIVLVVLLAFALWLRPPAVDFGNVAPVASSSGSTITTTSNGITINMGVNISVENPNFFAVKFTKISAEILYPLNGNQTDIGSGSASSINIDSKTTTNFTFPFTIDYSTSIDPDDKILFDIASKCGLLGGSKQDLTVAYKIKLGLQFAFIPISPTISNQFQFACPLTEQDLEGLLGGAGINLR